MCNTLSQQSQKVLEDFVAAGRVMNLFASIRQLLRLFRRMVWKVLKMFDTPSQQSKKLLEDLRGSGASNEPRLWINDICHLSKVSNTYHSSKVPNTVEGQSNASALRQTCAFAYVFSLHRLNVVCSQMLLHHLQMCTYILLAQHSQLLTD